MLTKVQRWGDSLALRIPKAFAVDANLEDNSAVEISVIKGKLIITPVVAQSWTLDELLAGINQHNVHHEIATGAAVGKEAW
jgi:antitoxin MazE